MKAGFDAAIIYNIDLNNVKKYSLIHSPQSGMYQTIYFIEISFYLFL